MRLVASLRHNLGSKLASVGLALLLWLFVHGSKVVEHELRVPIRYANLPDSVMFYPQEPPQMMRVLVSGRAQELLLRLRLMQQIEAHIDLATAGPPQYRIVPSIAQVVVPSRARVSMLRVLEPSVLDVRLARRVTRQTPVQLSWNREVPEDYILTDSLRLDPPVVLCSGPQFVVDTLAAILTLPFELRPRSAPVEELELQYPRQSVHCVPERVRVHIPLQRRRNRVLEAAQITVLPPSRANLAYEVRDQRAALVLSGPEARLDDLKQGDVVLTLDLRQLGVGLHDSLEVVPRVPAWAQVVSLKPRFTAAVIRGAASNRAGGGRSGSSAVRPEQHSNR